MFQYQKVLVSMTKLFQYQTIQYLKQDLDMIQVLEQSKEKPYRILVGKFQCIQFLFVDPTLNEQKYPYKKFLEISHIWKWI